MYLINVNAIHLFSKFNKNKNIIIKSCAFSKFVCADKHHRNGHNSLNQIIPKRCITDNKPVLNKYQRLYRYIRQFIRILRLKDRGITHNYKQDKTDKDLDVLIYRGEYNRKTVFWCLLCGVITNIAFAYLWIKYNILGSDHLEECDTTRIFTYKYALLVGMAYLTIIIVIARRTVLRIYYNQYEQKFILSIYRWYFPFSTKTFKCNYGEPVQVEPKFLRGNCLINNKLYNIEEDEFIYGFYSNLFFGFEKPEAFERFNEPKV